MLVLTLLKRLKYTYAHMIKKIVFGEASELIQF